MKDFVIYHKGCSDGVMGAAIAKTILSEAKFIEGEYNKEPNDIENSRIYFIDFCYKKDVMKRLLDGNNELIILDHHASQIQDNLELLTHEKVIDFTSKDNRHSGTGLVYQYFYGSSDLPVILKQIQDRDLWKWEDPLSKPLMSWLNLIPVNLDNYSELLDIILTEGFSDEELNNMVNIGKGILKSNTISQKSIIDSSLRFISINGYENIPCVNCSWNMMSDIGEYLNTTYPESVFSLMWCITSAGLKIGLRSKSDKTGADVSIIANSFHPKGGGHYSSAGASLNFEELKDNPIFNVIVGV